MTSSNNKPAPASDLVGTLGDFLFRQAVHDRVDLGDMRSVLQVLEWGGHRGADVADGAEEAVGYARARLQRRSALRDSLCMSLATFTVAAAALLAASAIASPDAAQAAGDAGPTPSGIADVLMATLPVVLAIGMLLWLRSVGRLPPADLEDVYGDTTLYGDQDR